MPTYRIDVPEIHYATYRVEAGSPEEALELVALNGGGTFTASEYYDTIAPEDKAYFVHDSGQMWLEYMYDPRNDKWILQ